MAITLQEGQTVGIDLGTTFSSIAQLDDSGAPQAIANSDGLTITPSVVILRDEGNVVVGPSFERISLETPDKIVEAIKREMGNKEFHVVYQDQRLTPEFVSALILKKLKQDCEAVIGPIANAERSHIAQFHISCYIAFQCTCFGPFYRVGSKKMDKLDPLLA